MAQPPVLWRVGAAAFRQQEEGGGASESVYACVGVCEFGARGQVRKGANDFCGSRGGSGTLVVKQQQQQEVSRP